MERNVRQMQHDGEKEKPQRQMYLSYSNRGAPIPRIKRPRWENFPSRRQQVAGTNRNFALELSCLIIPNDWRLIAGYSSHRQLTFDVD